MKNLGLKDIPVENIGDEALGLSDYASSLSEFIQKCETPLTIALQGDWGSGKTSLMNLIKDDLMTNKKVYPIWVNTWQYSQFGLQDELAISLLSHFLDKLTAGETGKKILSTLRSGLKNMVKKYAPSAVDGVLGDLGKTSF